MALLETAVTSPASLINPQSNVAPASDESIVRSLYRGLFLREPSPDELRIYLKRMRGGWRIEDVLHNIARSEKFADAVSLFIRLPNNSQVVSDSEYRCPTDLTVTPTPVRRLVVIGECLMAQWPDVIKEMHGNAECDFFLFRSVQELPETPPAPVSDYDFQLLCLPLRGVLPESAYFRLKYTDSAAYEALFQECRDRLRVFLAAAMKWNRKHGLLTFVSNFLVTQQNPMGRLLPRYDLRNLTYFVEKLNEALAEEVREYSNAHLFDFDQVVSTFGRKYFQDDVIAVTGQNEDLSDGDFAYDQGRLEAPVRASALYPHDARSYIRLAWTELLAMYRSIRQLDMVKLVVVDIDDTLWRGVAAESVEHSLDDVEGWPIGFVEALANLKRRGVLLAIVSKNEEQLVTPIWEQLYGDTFELDDFAIRKINWRPKVENFEEILRETNLLPRSVVYIDDNPVERAAINSAFPEVRTFGPNPLVWRRILLWSAETQVAAITAESGARTEMIRAQVERETQRRQLSREEFLASLNVKMNVRELASTEHRDFPRALELVNKSNQFNTSGKRWTRQEFVAALASDTQLFVFDVKDKFTSYGIVGVVVVRGTNIEQFVMSCRVVGLEVEIAAMARVLDSVSRKTAAVEITAELVETELNLLARDLWQRCGLKLRAGRWIHLCSNKLAAPAHIAM